MTEKRVAALVLCPTRELSAQVAREIRNLGRRHAHLRVVTVTGGEPVSVQRRSLEGDVHVVVGTPGRVLDLQTRRVVDLRFVKYVVLDEADRMLEMGFADEMKAILGQLPRGRQTVLFSATFPPGIEELSASYQRAPVRVTIDDAPAESGITEIAYDVTTPAKPRALLAVLEAHGGESSLVFCNQKATVEAAVGVLAKAGYSADRLHGDLDQHARNLAMAKFRNGSVRVLVATDVAARGLDVDDLDLVVNVDLPNQSEIYVHRVGRTARAGKRGTAVSLVTPADRPRLSAIEAETGRTVERRSVIGKSASSESVLSHKASMVTVYVSGGRKDKLRPGDLLGALTGEAGGLKGTDVGKIELHDTFAYVAVARHVASAAAASLSAGKIKGRKFRARVEA